MILTTVSQDNIAVKVYAISEWPDLYADWVNNFLTVPRFAEYYGITEGQAQEIIAVGKETDNFSKPYKF
jgi:hypothetical protein